MTTEQVVNLNIDAKTLEQCLKSTSNFGETILRNICTGQTTTVPWGSVDWALAIFLCLLGAAVLGVIIGFVGAIIGFVRIAVFDL